MINMNNELDLHNVPQTLIVLIILVLFLSIGAAILAAMSNSSSNSGTTYAEKVLFTGGTATLGNNYCSAINSFGTFETSWPLP